MFLECQKLIISISAKRSRASISFKSSWNEINEFINDEDLTDRIYYFLRTEKEEQEQESTDENLESPGKTTDDNALHDHHNDVPEAPV